MTELAPEVVLGIDQAARSGWAVYIHGLLCAHGVLPNHANAGKCNAERIAVVKQALAFASSPGNLLVVFEDHSDISLSAKTRFDPSRRYKKPTRNAATILGMGGAKARWEDRLDDLGHPERLRISVTSADWRKRVLGMSNYCGADKLEAAAKRWASAEAKKPIEDDNEAEAICIARWGALDGVAVLLGKQVATRAKGRAYRERKKQAVIVVDGKELAE